MSDEPPTIPGQVRFTVEAIPYESGANGEEWHTGCLPARDVARVLRQIADRVERDWTAEAVERPSGPTRRLAAARTRTPDRIDPDTGWRIVTVQRACNGCGQTIGDVTDREIRDGIHGLPLTDVRGECPRCST